ncbi:Cyclic AMP response element-binding protein B [Aphelenchoides besseyi]|nr:Cyclic AMP response element-binding protein B [Aphelenchoides besseyi]KAI6235671.1 Cyclic AMP response element-binding protein B [Aphelenchoides besseyi]
MSSLHSSVADSPDKQIDRQNLLDEIVLMSEDEARRRREQLNRRPSYRMILKDLETVSDKSMKKEIDDSTTERPNSNLLGPPSSNANSVHFEVPTSTHLTNGGGAQSGQSSTRNVETPQPQGGGLRSGSTASASTVVAPGMRNQNDSCPPGDPTISPRILNPPRSAVSDIPSQPQPQIHTSAIAQPILPMATSNGLSLLPVSNDLVNMKNVNDQISLATSLANYSQNNDWSSGLLTQYSSGHSPLTAPNLQNRQGSASVTSLSDNDESNRKRQVRLMKNREAAKECRRKKKEYVKCLENRVAVLENQNKALIEELKTLKELYCRKEKSEV